MATKRDQKSRSVLLAEAGPGRTIAKYKKGQAIFAQGDDADAVYYVQTGRVKVTVLSEAGKAAIVAILGADEFCGEGGLAGQPVRLGTASALVESKVMRLENATVARLLHDDAAFAETFVAHLLQRTVRVEADLVDQLFNSTEKRLARTLLLLANFGNVDRPQPILAKVSQEMLAEVVGTTRSHVSRFMNKFRKLGFISYDGEIEVHNSLLNVVLNFQPDIGRLISEAEPTDDAR